MNTYDAAHTLAKAIRESNEMKELREAKEALKADESAKNMLIDFRNEQIKMQEQKLQGIEVARESEEKLVKLYEVVNLNTLVKGYLEAEYKILRMLDDIQKIIAEATRELVDKDLINLPERFIEEPDDE